MLALADGPTGIEPGLEAADVGCLGDLAAGQQLIVETVAVELRHHREIAAPGVGVAEGGDGALEFGAGLGGVGLAAFGHGVNFLLNEAAPAMPPARRV